MYCKSIAINHWHRKETRKRVRLTLSKVRNNRQSKFSHSHIAIAFVLRHGWKTRCSKTVSRLLSRRCLSPSRYPTDFPTISFKSSLPRFQSHRTRHGHLLPSRWFLRLSLSYYANPTLCCKNARCRNRPSHFSHRSRGSHFLRTLHRQACV